MSGEGHIKHQELEYKNNASIELYYISFTIRQ